jgi:hypothetical protein
VNQVFEPPEKPLETFCRGGLYPALLNRSSLGLSRAAYMPPLQNADLVVIGAGFIPARVSRVFAGGSFDSEFFCSSGGSR